MTVTYRSTRATVAKWQWYSLRHNRIHQLMWVALELLLMVVGLSWSRMLGVGAVGSVVACLAAALLGAAFSALYPQMRFDAQVRLLTPSDEGLATTIGARFGIIPWSQVAGVAEWAGVVLVTSKGGSAFLVPFDAFASPEEREEFIGSCRNGLAGGGGGRGRRSPARAAEEGVVGEDGRKRAPPMLPQGQG